MTQRSGPRTWTPIVITSAILVATPFAPASADELKVLLGPSLTSAHLAPLDRPAGSTSDTSAGLSLGGGGVGIELEVLPSWILELDALVAVRSYTVETSSIDTGGTGRLTLTGTRSTTWIQFPVIFRRSFVDCLSIGVGLQGGVRLGASDTSALETSTSVYSSSLSNVEWAAVLAAGARLPVGNSLALVGDVRALLPLNDLDTRSQEEERLRTFQLLVGLAIGL